MRRKAAGLGVSEVVSGGVMLRTFHLSILVILAAGPRFVRQAEAEGDIRTACVQSFGNRTLQKLLASEAVLVVAQVCGEMVLIVSAKERSGSGYKHCASQKTKSTTRHSQGLGDIEEEESRVAWTSHSLL